MITIPVWILIVLFGICLYLVLKKIILIYYQNKTNYWEHPTHELSGLVGLIIALLSIIPITGLFYDSIEIKNMNVNYNRCKLIRYCETENNQIIVKERIQCNTK